MDKLIPYWNADVIPNEEWGVHKASGIQVSDMGRVMVKGKKTRGCIRQRRFTTRKDGKTWSVARLVLETFQASRRADWGPPDYGNRDGKGVVAWGKHDQPKPAHRDFKLDCRFENLYWRLWDNPGWTDGEQAMHMNFWRLWKRREVRDYDHPVGYGKAGPKGTLPEFWDREIPTDFTWWRFWYKTEFKLGPAAVEAKMRKLLWDFHDYSDVNLARYPQKGLPPAYLPKIAV